MSSGKCTTIPRSFSWVLPIQSLVTGLAIYSTVFVFKVGSKTFILAVVAAGIQFVLGLYSCFTANKPGFHHAIVMPILLTGIAGVWCGPLYYFARITDVWVKVQRAFPGSGAPSAATWSYIGLAAACVDVIIALALLAIFLVEGLKSPQTATAYNSFDGYTSAPAYSVPACEPNTYPFQQPQSHYQGPFQPVMTGAQPYPVPPYTATATPDKSIPATTTTPISPITTPTPFQGQPLTSAPHDHTNRLSSIERICALQSPAGSWT